MHTDTIKQRIESVTLQAGVPKDSYAFVDLVSEEQSVFLDIDVTLVPGVKESRVAGGSCGRTDIDTLPASQDSAATRKKILQLATEKASAPATIEKLAGDVGGNPAIWAKHSLVPPAIETGHNARCMEGCDDCNSKGKVRCHTCKGHAKLQCGGCRGGGIVRCNTCGGDGMDTCGGCCGSGRTSYVSGGNTHYQVCSGCGGRGRTLGCYGCGTSGQVYCSGCDGHGEIGCGTCSRTGTLKCNPCDGHGMFVRTFVGTMKATIKRAYGYKGSEKPLPTLIPALDDDPCFKPEKIKLEKLPDRVTAGFRFPMPFAALTLEVGKDKFRIQAGGKRMTWANVPPYLDRMLAGFVESLERAPAREARDRIVEMNGSELGKSVVKGVVTKHSGAGSNLYGGAISQETVDRLRRQAERFLAQAIVGPRIEFWTRFMLFSVLLTAVVAIVYPYLNNGKTTLTAVSIFLYPRGFAGSSGVGMENLFMSGIVAALILAPTFVAGKMVYGVVSRSWLTRITGMKAEVPAKAGRPAFLAGLASLVFGAATVMLVQQFPAIITALTA